jgi:hypothetical protein
MQGDIFEINLQTWLRNFGKTPLILVFRGGRVPLLSFKEDVQLKMCCLLPVLAMFFEPSLN